MSVALDLMHNLYLGWLQYFFGSVFLAFVLRMLGPRPFVKFAHSLEFYEGSIYNKVMTLDTNTGTGWN